MTIRNATASEFKEPSSSSFLTGGDIGDALYAAPSMKLVAAQVGAPCVLFCRDGLRLHDPFTSRIPLFKSLFESQDYCHAVLPWEGQDVTHDIHRFRDQGHPYGVTLGQLQAQFVGLAPDFSQPWLSVDPDSCAPIIVARSHRYRNHLFPWGELVEAFGEEMAFIGLEEEHKDFCAECGKVEYVPTKTLLEAARAIAGSKLFVGNQSAPYAIAEGLKHTSILEVCQWMPDCIYRRPNATYCYDGALDFEFRGKRFSTPAMKLAQRADPGETPPGGWRISLGGHSIRSYSFQLVENEITEKLMELGDPIPENLKEMIIVQSSVDLPPPEPWAPILRLRQLLS